MKKRNPSSSFRLRRRKRVARSAVALAAATTALLVFILVQGDLRRRQRAMDQARWHASTLEGRLGPGGVLPLNLQPVAVPERQSPMFRVEWLARDDARRLRRSGKPCIVAQTVPLLQVLGRDGRAVIFFTGKRFDVKWLTLAEFDRRRAAQREDIRRPADETSRGSSEGP